MDCMDPRVDYRRVEGNHSWASGQSSETVATKERKAVTSAGNGKGADEDREATLTQRAALALDLEETNLPLNECSRVPSEVGTPAAP